MAHNKDMVNHPDHYNQGGIECIDAMVAAFGKAKVFDFCHLNAMKYLWRAGRKGSIVEDMRKAQWYLDKAISLIEEPVKPLKPKDYNWNDARSHEAD